MQGGLLLYVVVCQGAPILKLLPGKDKTLLVRWDALLVLNLGLDVVNCVRRLHLKGDSLTRKGLHENLHLKTAATTLGSWKKNSALFRR